MWTELEAYVLFVNDGSKDDTLAVVQDYVKKVPNLGYVNLSRNFGKEQAIAAGLSVVPSNQNVIIMDGDGQHTPEAVSKLIAEMENDKTIDIAFGVRETRKYQGWLDRSLSKVFYKLVNMVLAQPLNDQLGDFFLARSTVLPTLKSFKDSKLFWKGIYSWIGFNRSIVPITIKDRQEGTSKFSFLKKFALAIDGVVSLTKFPLHLISILGVVISVSSFILGLWFIGKWMITGISVPGFYTIIVLQSFIGGIIMLSLGIIALYLAVIFENTSSKPGFLLSPSANLPKWPKT